MGTAPNIRVHPFLSLFIRVEILVFFVSDERNVPDPKPGKFNAINLGGREPKTAVRFSSSLSTVLQPG